MRNQLPIKLIKKYQANKQIIGTGHCKYIPSCSNYAIEVYEKFNFFYASLLTLWRIIRCNPLAKHRVDLVPLSKEEKIKKNKLHVLEETYGFDIVSTLIDHYKKYPSLQMEDLIKLLFQVSEGPQHLVVDKESINKEISNMVNPLLGKENPLVYIGNDYFRFDLRAIKRFKFNIDEIVDIIQKTCDDANSIAKEDRFLLFNQYLELLSELINAKIIDIETKEMKIVNTPHHSQTYNDIYHPHYRIMNIKYIPQEFFDKLVIDKIKHLTNKKQNIIIAFDGDSSADYSKYIELLKKNFNINIFNIHDFINPHLKKAKADFINIKHFKNEVLDKINNKRFSYTPYDFVNKTNLEQVVVESKQVNIVFNSGSYSPNLAPYYDYVFYINNPIDNSDTDILNTSINKYLVKYHIKYLADMIIK